ncbi:glycoside hydrolase family 17 protein [Thermothielavioides terrestris NRRL 8126]|uniref:Probable beta-glucosidase btgE n=1 Tax=Thermothielavioides terrestris (strain ATCC 38088 / NRRL 8126) TaxID=578455 RepID=G2R2H5_THETT|nr:glycoside hydrolase family 17 protein [Thermothielavioides terrestris NRRL 8126]AEO65848.1 glycoside hydrolase family 17 protein [Thermothielavioides terrestris NRRL 8126]
MGGRTLEATLTDSAVVPPAPQTSTPAPQTSTPAPVPTTTAGPITVPTPIAQTCPTPGTYSFPATTVVVTETTTVCGASVTTVPSGTHTLGGVTTVVETATTVVCPYATTETQPNGVVTSVLKTTTYVCPSAGTYTIAPITTHVPSVTTVVVPVVTTYCPGTYTAPAVVTTVTETDVVVYCPFTSSEAPAPTTVPASTSAQASPAPAQSSSAPSLGGGNGKLWAITYTPYTASGDCKSASEVLSDVADIAKAGFTTLRVYSTDCDTLPNVGAAARAHGLRMIVGIFIGEVGCDNASPDVADQIAALKEWKQWDLVDLCVVANEALANGFCTVSQLTDLITHVKSELASVGYTGPFTTTDVVASWINNDVSSICAVIDYVATNAHAYFNAQTLPAAAGTFVAGQLAIVEKVCGKSGFVLETGWPTAGNCNGVACAGESEQRTAIEAIKNELGEKVVFFSFRDDPWKQPGACNCEQHWGCASVFGA